MKSTKPRRKKTRTKHTNRPSAIADMPELITVSEAAPWLRVSQWSAYDMVRRGVLPVVRLGRLVRIQRAALEQLAGRR